jgi:hypothetical protein
MKVGLAGFECAKSDTSDFATGSEPPHDVAKLRLGIGGWQQKNIIWIFFDAYLHTL